MAGNVLCKLEILSFQMERIAQVGYPPICGQDSRPPWGENDPNMTEKGCDEGASAFFLSSGSVLMTSMWSHSLAHLQGGHHLTMASSALGQAPTGHILLIPTKNYCGSSH